MSRESKQVLEPGTLDRIRKNLGDIDQEEALIMQKKLGGEILKERSIPIDTSKLPSGKKTYAHAKRSKQGSSSEGSSSSSSSFSAGSSSGDSGYTSRASVSTGLRDVPPRELKLMNRLLMEYEIKPDYGFFTIFYNMSSKNKEKVTKRFAEYIVKRHIEHMQSFVSTIKTFIQFSPDTYKTKIMADADLKFRLLRTVGKWNMQSIKLLGIQIEQNSDSVTITDLIPFVRSVYKMFLTIYYLTEKTIAQTIKEIVTDLCAYPNMDQKKINNFAKVAITEWIYIQDHIIKGMYPLLMRMCSDEYVEFPEFFKSNISDILKFLDMSKFDIMIPEKNKKPKTEEQKEEAKKEEEKKKEDSRRIAGQKDELVSMGIKILDQLFPLAGFSNLDNHPDMYPYFQPIYSFDDGFNMLHPDNPVQVTIVLLKIIEDFFKAARNINFNFESDDEINSIPDNLVNAMNEWASYREDLFDKKYGDYLRHYVNNIYSTKDYQNSQGGKTDLNNLYWRGKYYFLPHYKFSAPILQKPVNDTKFKPLYGRTDYIKTVLSILINRIDESAPRKGDVQGIVNPWQKYTFDLPNPISKRIDVLLGANRDADVTAATNANLIKYSLCVVSVLDWWINNPSSPAYSTDPTHIYRISEKDGAPEFSVPTRTDQNTLFADGVKKAIAAKKAKAGQ